MVETTPSLPHSDNAGNVDGDNQEKSKVPLETQDSVEHLLSELLLSRKVHQDIVKKFVGKEKPTRSDVTSHEVKTLRGCL